MFKKPSQITKGLHLFLFSLCACNDPIDTSSPADLLDMKKPALNLIDELSSELKSITEEKIKETDKLRPKLSSHQQAEEIKAKLREFLKTSEHLIGVVKGFQTKLNHLSSLNYLDTVLNKIIDKSLREIPLKTLKEMGTELDEMFLGNDLSETQANHVNTYVPIITSTCDILKATQRTHIEPLLEKEQLKIQSLKEKQEREAQTLKEKEERERQREELAQKIETQRQESLNQAQEAQAIHKKQLAKLQKDLDQAKEKIQENQQRATHDVLTRESFMRAAQDKAGAKQTQLEKEIRELKELNKAQEDTIKSNKLRIIQLTTQVNNTINEVAFAQDLITDHAESISKVNRTKTRIVPRPHTIPSLIPVN